MDPELKAYLDEIRTIQRSILDMCRNHIDALDRSMDATACCFTVPVKSSSGETELSGETDLDTALARAAVRPDTVPAVREPPAVVHVAPIDTIAMVPACCSTECVTEAVTTTDPFGTFARVPASCSTECAAQAFTKTLLQCVSVSSSSPATSLTNGVVSTKLATDNEDRCPDAPVTAPIVAPTSPAARVDVIPMLAAPATSDATLDGEPMKDAAAATLTSSLERTLAVTPVVSSELTFDIDDKHEVGIIPADAPVCIPWAFTRPWLEPVPPRPPDPWSLSAGAWSGSRLGARMTVESTVNTVLLRNKAEEVSVHILSDEVTQQDGVHQQPWPPPLVFCENSLRDEQQEVFGNASSVGLLDCSFNCPRGTTLATPESQVLHLLNNFSDCVSCGLAEDECSAKEKWSFNALLLRVHEWAPDIQCVQHACLNSYVQYGQERYTIGVLQQVFVSGSVLALFSSGSPNSFSVADLLDDADPLKCTNRAQDLTGEHLVEAPICQNIEARLRESCRRLFPDHHSRLGFVFLGVPTTWPHFSMVQITELAPKDISFQPDSILSLDSLLSQRCGFGLTQWKTAWSRQWECFENASTKFEASLHPNVGKETIQANFMVACYGLVVPTAWSVFSTKLRQASRTPHIKKKTRQASVTSVACIWSSQSMALLSGAENGSNFREFSLSLLSVWQHAYTQWSWNPGGCTFGLCSSKSVTTTLHCHEQFQGSSLRFSCAFQIWLVAWTMDGLEFSTRHRQTLSQGGRNLLRGDFIDHVQVNHDYYITGTNQDYYVSYSEECHNDSTKTNKVYMSWDPGKSRLKHTRKLRLGDKPSFKEGGMLGSPSRAHAIGPIPWARKEGLSPAQSQLQFVGYIYPATSDEEVIQWITAKNGGGADPQCNRLATIQIDSSCIPYYEPYMSKQLRDL